MDDEAGIAVGGTLACRGSEGVFIRVVNRLSVSPGPPSVRGEFAFWETVAHPNPDVRRRRVVNKVRCTFLIRKNTFKFNEKHRDFAVRINVLNIHNQSRK